MATIYETSPRSSPYTVVVGAKPLNEWLGGWMAKSVIVDNHATQHLLLPDVGIYCPPLTVGKVVPLTGLGRVQAMFATPPGYTTAPAKAGQICNLTFYAADLPPNPGVADGLLGVTSPRQQLWPDGTALAQQVGPSFQVAANTNLTKTFTLPAGTTDARIGAIITGGSPAVFTYAVFVLGHTTNIRYFPKSGTGVPLGPRQPITVPIDIEYDPKVDVQISTDATNALDIYVTALTQVEAVETYTQEPQLVTFSSVALQPSAALWQAPNKPPKSMVIPLGALGIQNQIPAVAGQTVYLFALQFTPNSTGAFGGNFQDTAGAAIHFEGVQQAGPRTWLFSGAALPPGLGLDFNVTANGAPALQGSVVYSQG